MIVAVYSNHIKILNIQIAIPLCRLYSIHWYRKMLGKLSLELTDFIFAVYLIRFEYQEGSVPKHSQGA